MEEQGYTPNTRKVDNNAPLFVSLYVVLLAFFILLVAISQRDAKRVEEVAAGVANSFKIPRKLVSKPITPGVATQMGAASFFDEMQEIVSQEIAIDQLNIVQQGSTLEITFPKRLMFVPGQTEVRPEFEPLLSRIAANLAKWSEGQRTDVMVMLGYNDPFTSGAGADERIEIARAGAFTRDMLARGVPEKTLQAGVTPLNPRDVLLHFDVRAKEDGEAGGGSDGSP